MRKHSLWLVLWVAGCGGGTASTGAVTRGCDLQATDPPQNQCVDYIATADEETSLGTSCAAVSGGQWLAGPCDHTTAVGGCRLALGQGSDIVEIEWWFAGALGGLVTDSASAQEACATLSGATLVQP